MIKNFIEKLCFILCIVGGLFLIVFTVGFLWSFMRIPAGDVMFVLVKIVVLITLLAYLLVVILKLINYIYIKMGKDSLLFVSIYDSIFKYDLFYIIKVICYFPVWLFLFGFLAEWCFYAVKQKEYIMLFFSLPFWAFGIFAVYYFVLIVFKKKSKKLK